MIWNLKHIYEIKFLKIALHYIALYMKIVYFIYNAIKGPSSKQNECGKQYLIMPLYLLYTDRMHLSAATLSLTRLPCRYVKMCSKNMCVEVYFYMSMKKIN